MTTETRRVVDPSTRFELVTTEDSKRLNGRRGVPLGLRCAVCGETARLGSDVEHLDGCAQADVRLHLTSD